MYYLQQTAKLISLNVEFSPEKLKPLLTISDNEARN